VGLCGVFAGNEFDAFMVVPDGWVLPQTGNAGPGAEGSGCVSLGPGRCHGVLVCERASARLSA